MLHRKVCFLFLLFISFSSQGSQIVIVNMDAAGEGFNDNTPVVASGGNSGSTIGQQRLQVFEFAARIWESLIDSNITIRVEANFDPLFCDSSSAVLGSAGPGTIHRSFSNAPISNTWYAVALANSLASSDLSSSNDITATFNGDIDNNSACLGNFNWYYGLDGVKPSRTIEMLSVVLHEIGHGLGFVTFVDLNSGAKFGTPARNDAYMLNLEDHSLSKNWDSMSNNQRKNSSIDNGDLHWTGNAVTSRIADFSAGISQGHVRMFAPSPLQSGSSVSHFDKALSPNELMEPVDTGPKQGAGLAKELLQDIGWAIFNNFTPVISDMSDLNSSGPNTTQDFIVRDTDHALSSLSISVSSSNTAVVDVAGLDVTGSGNVRSLNITPASAGISNITLTVSDGVASSSSSFQLTVINNAPQVLIDLPLDNADQSLDYSVLFQASANDIEDGDLSSSVTWQSSLDGVLGIGSAIDVLLTEGSHQITASVIDSITTSAFHTITVNVIGDGDLDGMNDLWEVNAFGDTSRDGSGDFDSDGISDLNEYLISIVVINGDINNDGQVNVADVLLATRHVNQLSILSLLQIARGDLYPVGAPDAQISLSDIILLQKIIHD